MSKISVIIPIYNVEEYLRECLDSVVNQTFQDLEIICVNDGSTDGSLAILEEYATKDSRIQIVNKENGGQNTARNAGLDRVTSDYFVIIDADDWIDLTAYEKAYDRAIETAADMTQFSFKFVNFPNQKDVTLPQIDETNEALEKVKIVTNNWAVCWCFLWKTSFVKKNKLRFHNELKNCNEITFTYKAAILANKIAVLCERFYYYRYRTTSLTGNKKEPTLLQAPWAFTLLFEDIADCNISDEVRLFLLHVKWINLWETYYRKIDKNFHPKFRQQIRTHELEGEFEILKRHADELDFQKRTFFTILYSKSIIERLRIRIEIIKHWYTTKRGNFCDGLAKRLVPYSPWLQMACQTVDSQREEIQRLTAQREENHA